MKNIPSFIIKTKTILKKALVITLILGILSSAFGIGVVALSKITESTETESTSQGTKNSANTKTDSKYKSPTDGSNSKNEIGLNSSVKVLTKQESDKINSSITLIEYYDSSYEKDRLKITLKGNKFEYLEDIDRGDIFYIQGDESSPLGGDRIFEMIYTDIREDETIVDVREPDFEEVFDDIDLAVSDTLTEENFVDGTYAEGVDSHFGDVEKEIPDAVKPTPETETTATTSSNNKADDLIVDIDYDYQDNRIEDYEYDGSSSFEIKGKFGIKDLTAHLIAKMEGFANFKDLYFGLSGETFVDIDVNYQVDDDDQLHVENTAGPLSHEEIRSKRFPIAILEFKGKTPLTLSDDAFSNKSRSIVPTMFVMLYADWTGEITLELNASFEFSDSFNHGLRVAKDGKFSISFEDYPYPPSHDVEAKNGFEWNADARIDADQDVTVFGSSMLFYVAGVNIGEIAIAKLGIQTKDEISIEANSKEGVVSQFSDDSYSYVRGYLKVLDTNINLSQYDDYYLSKQSFKDKCKFSLLDITMYEDGTKPSEYKSVAPIASKKAPKESSSVMTLVCDVSGSMFDTIETGQTKLESAKEAAKMVVDTTETWSKNNEESNSIGVVQFSDDAISLCQPHIDYKYIKECISNMEDGGGTNIYTGIDAGIEQLKAVSSENKVMILMTDGQDSADQLTRESAEVAAKNNIKIYTIGFGADVNETLLTEIAESTGGEYRFADTNNMMGIIGSFMYAQQASNASVLTEIEDTVAEGETTEAKKFKVDDKNGNLMITTAWPGSFLDTILVDPNGREVDENYPGAVIDETQIPSTITVSNPIKGDWEVSVKGVETSYEEEPFYTIVAFKEMKDAKINTQMSVIEIIAAYCIPIGLFLTLASVLFLISLGKKKKTEDKENKAE